MRAYLLLFFLCCCFPQTWGQSYRHRMETAIDMGTFSEPFTYTDTQDLAKFPNDFYYQDDPNNDWSNDIFYKFTLTKSLDIRFDGKSLNSNHDIHFNLLDTNGERITERYYGSTEHLQTGTYYLVFELSIYSGNVLPDIMDISFSATGISKLPGDDLFYLLNLGTFDTNFQTSYTIDKFDDYGLDFKELAPYNNGGCHDFICHFTINQPMELTVDNCGTNIDMRNNFHHCILLSASMDSINPHYKSNNCKGYKRYELDAGSYYLYAWSFVYANHYGNKYVLNLEGREFTPGSNFSRPIDIGSRSDSFTFTDAKNTGDYSRSHLPQKNGNEVFYQLTVVNPMELTIDNCGSEIADTYLQVFSEDKKLLYSNDNSTGEYSCPNTLSASIHVPLLLPGTYYIVTDAATNGNVTTTVTGRFIAVSGDTKEIAINAGGYEAGFLYTDTRDSSIGFTNAFTGKNTNDIFYKIHLKKSMDVTFSHCGSALSDTYLSILNEAGNELYSNDDFMGEDHCGNTKHARIRVEQMQAGTYYVVSEGNSTNGPITTTIEARSLYDILNTTIGQPHVITLTPAVATNDLSSLKADNTYRDIQYYDYFGNPVLNIKHGFAPQGGDLVMLQEYDGFNRESNLWLPVLKNTSGGAYLSPFELQESARAATYYGNDASPFTRPVYENSPLNRIIAEYGAGYDWKNHPVKTDILTNLGNTDVFSEVDKYFAVHIYSISNDSLLCKGTYQTGTLDVTRVTDEDNRISFEVKDRTGRVVLNRQLCDNQLHDTYYVYDNYGNLGVVLPPMAADSLSGIDIYHIDNTVLQKYAYTYKYDSRNRCIYKRLPGCDPAYSVYDSADRVVFTQDGNQRMKQEWSFNIPDAFGRTVITGTCKNGLDYTSNPLDSIVVKATWAKAENVMKGYTVTGVTIDSPTILSANYYDHYDFLGLNSIPATQETSYEDTPGYGERYSKGNNGLLTGTLAAQYSHDSLSPEYLYSVMYYDDRERMIQQKGNNASGGKEQVCTGYNFSGQVTQMKKMHSLPGRSTQTEVYRHSYDHGGRLIRTTYQLNDKSPIILAENVYDEIGRLKTDKRNGNANLKTDYAYNIRSWMKGINGALFNQSLHYQDAYGENTPCYNGNISCMTWKTESTDKGYQFTYDGLSRMKNAIYGEASNLAANANRFNEQITGYDKMGNILGLLRYGQTSSSGYGLIDNLNLTYNGNQLQSVYDNATNTVFENGMEFRNGANQAIEYEYDKNGNLTKDLNKKITDIQYNLLNLPSQITFENGSTIQYVYDANGTKLRTIHNINGVTQTTDYCGNAVYENGELNMMLNEAGYYSFQDSKFHFYLKDHLGNVRVVADEDGNVEETNDYYPFGGLMSNSSTRVQLYKYNGKELDRKAGLDWYDYGARHYDAAIGRWCVMDPMSENYHEVSPYNYCMSNPARFIDMDGMEADDPIRLPEVTIIGQKVMNPVSGFWNSVGYYLLGRTLTYPVYGVTDNLRTPNPIGYITYNVNKEGIATSIAPKGGVGPTPAKTGLSFKEIAKLLEAGKAISKAGLTAVGRGLQKHGSRAGSAFQKVTGNQAAINQQGETVLKSILENPNVVVTSIKSRSVGEALDYKIPGGIGARFSRDNSRFIGFLEPD